MSVQCFFLALLCPKSFLTTVELSFRCWRKFKVKHALFCHLVTARYANIFLKKVFYSSFCSFLVEPNRQSWGGNGETDNENAQRRPHSTKKANVQIPFMPNSQSNRGTDSKLNRRTTLTSGVLWRGVYVKCHRGNPNPSFHLEAKGLQFAWSRQEDGLVLASPVLFLSSFGPKSFRSAHRRHI